MKLVVTFIVVFVGGPLLFWKLARRRPEMTSFSVLMVLALALMALAFGVGRWLVPAYATSPYPGLGAIAMIWLAWVVMLAFCVQAVGLRLRSAPARKAAFAIGAMATTLPWFGLYFAQMMAS